MSEPDKYSGCYTCSWQERVEQVINYGTLVGALQGLLYSVDPKTKERIEKILLQVGEDPNPI